MYLPHIDTGGPSTRLLMHSLLISLCRCPDWLLLVAGLECHGQSVKKQVHTAA